MTDKKPVGKLNDTKDAKCPWCQYLPQGKCTAKECDFKSLPYEKEAILKRLSQEADAVAYVRDEIARSDDFNADEFEKIMDISFGMQIMVTRLKADFGMQDEEIKKYIGVKKMSMWQKAKLAAKMQQMKGLRGRK